MNSPYKQYLGTNYSPTTNEARGIRLVLDGTAQELVALDSQIDIVRRQLDSLQERRSAIHNFAEQHRALLSPARKLTPDILEDIFLACLPSDRNPCMSTSEAPMLLMQICGSWRQIAMSAPRLWAAIHIVIPNICLELYPARSEVVRQLALISDALKQRETAVSEWLGRSGVRPLSISVYEVTPLIGDDNGDGINFSTLRDLQKLHLTFLVNTILPYHQQWRELDVCLEDGTLDGLIDSGLKAASLKALKSLHVTRKSHFHQAQLDAPKYQWKDVVALLPVHATSATFNYFQVRASDFSSIPQSTWQGLTELNLSLNKDVSLFLSSTNIANMTVGILFCCHSLVSLTLHIDRFESSQSPSPDEEKIILPRVKTLSIALTTSLDGVSIVKRLSLPSLMEMNVQFSRSTGEVEMANEIVRSLLSSGGHIRTLNLCASYWMNVPDHLIQILKVAPEVKSLTISTKGIRSKWDDYVTYPASRGNVRNVVTDNLLQSLSPFGNVDVDIICPMLEEFVCTPDLITGITERGLKNFLMARKRDQRVSNIRRISVFINELKKEPVVGEEQISLGPDSFVGFKKSTPKSMSPFEGYESDKKFIGPAIPIEVYTEI